MCGERVLLPAAAVQYVHQVVREAGATMEPAHITYREGEKRSWGSGLQLGLQLRLQLPLESGVQERGVGLAHEVRLRVM